MIDYLERLIQSQRDSEEFLYNIVKDMRAKQTRHLLSELELDAFKRVITAYLERHFSHCHDCPCADTAHFQNWLNSTLEIERLINVQL